MMVLGLFLDVLGHDFAYFAGLGNLVNRSLSMGGIPYEGAAAFRAWAAALKRLILTLKMRPCEMKVKVIASTHKCKPLAIRILQEGQQNAIPC